MDLLMKNLLDNEYSKTLSYLQITIVGIITASVGGVIFLLQSSSLLFAVLSIFLGIFSGIVIFTLFNRKLEEITLKIKNLS